MNKACTSFRIFLLMALAVVFSNGAQAQWLPAYSWARRNHKAMTRKASGVARYNASLDSLIARYRHYEYNAPDTLSNPFYASLFGSPSLYGAAINRSMAVPDSAVTPSQLPS